MPSHALENCSGAAVIAAQRASGNHMSHMIHGSSSRNKSLKNASQEDIMAHSLAPRKSIYQRSYSRRAIGIQTCLRRTTFPSSSTNCTSRDMPPSLTLVSYNASFDIQTSTSGEESSISSNRSSLVCIQDFPREDMPWPGWQILYVEDVADTYQPLKDPDEYLYVQKPQRSSKGMAFSWKGVKRVRDPGNRDSAYKADSTL